MRLATILLCAAVSTMAQGSLPGADWREWLNRGVQEFKNARYIEAAEDFQKAVDLNPNEVSPWLYLATAYMQQFIPGAGSADNVAMAQKADAAFRGVLERDAGNRVALASLASLALNQKRYGEAADWYQRLLVVNPQDAESYYSLGFIAWAKWYPAYSKARGGTGMQPSDPGPIRDVAVRAKLRSEYWTVLEDGIRNLNKALELNPRYSDAMAYLNLLVRERADLRDTPDEYTRDIAEADEWMEKTLAAKAAQVQQRNGGTPPGTSGQSAMPIRVDGAVQQRKLISQAAAVYPPLAQQAGVEGNVRLSVLIGADGAVKNVQVISGHPLLVPPAVDAVKLWRYQPTLWNGSPVEVLTVVDVSFGPGR